MQIIENLPALPPRSVDGHKYSFGTVLLFAGSRNMTGAAVLAACAAARAGAGLVQVACPRSAQATIAAANPCYTTIPLNEDSEGRIDETDFGKIFPFITKADIVAIGPGLGQSASLQTLIRGLVFQRAKPTVVDADGLNNLAGADLSRTRGNIPLIVTPHEGEFSRLTQKPVDEIQANRAELAAEFAPRLGGVLVLKGHRTIITDGRKLAINPTGNPGMATGGTGDVLTGIIAALLGQGMAPMEAAQLGVYVHGLAGDIAARRLGMISLIATDLIRFLPYAFQQIENARKPQ